ncbi:pathogenicity island protein [Staphylococcus epidermidis]|uniref:pathogenicity island protein n=1 Tax=Staphylococcus epidermidis TaxID=1282 RepID=UPI0021CFAE49|nr:pathogenicity island protein [Staphylococcus epidermidis]MCG2074778.1 pathogenicity island protein [Staphylococcus epidermidis]UXR98605.1 pathogenicity island protein [Staphylococcus epidermidis]
MKNLTNQDFKNIEGKLNYDHIVNGKKNTKKMSKLLQREYRRDASIIKGEYPRLSDSEISEIILEYRNYKELVKATETLMEFPINYEDSNVIQFITKEDIEDLKLAIEEITIFVESLEEY